MEYNIENCTKRYNDAIYELYLAEKFMNKQNESEAVRNLRAAAESISQSLELSLKLFLNRKLKGVEKHYLKVKATVPELIGRYLWDDGVSGDYYFDTVEDTIEPTVDFDYLKRMKGPLTNYGKHEGAEPNKDVIENYITQSAKFIKQYLDKNASLKKKSDFEKNNSANWDLLYSACDRFNSDERTLILIIGPNQNIDEYHLKSLSLPKWNLVIDFDYDSQRNGLYKAAFSAKVPTPHNYKIADTVDTSSFSPYSQTHYHLFANNFSGSGEVPCQDFNSWNIKYAKKADSFIKSFSEVFSNQKIIVLSLFQSRRHVNSVCEKIQQHFGENTSFIFANDLKDELNQTAEDFRAIKVNVSLTEIADGLNDYSSNFGVARQDSGKYVIPHMELSETKTSGELSPSEFAQLEEYFEVVHKGLPLTEAGEIERREFLTGVNKISWYGLKKGFDVQRKSFQKSFIKPLERVFENTRGKINLVHDAGFGGTTVARRIAWHFHEEYPTLILKKFRDNKVRELLINLHQKTRKTIFLILEVPQSITLDDVNNLYKSIPQARPVVFLMVKRGKPKQSSDLVINDWGNEVPELVSAYRPYLDEYEDELLKKKKNEELDKIIDSSDINRKTPFYVGLLTFEEKFFAIKDYIRKFCIEVLDKDEQKRALLYLSICEDYIGQGLPSAFFKKLFKVESEGIFLLEKYFLSESGIVDSLLSTNTEGIHKFWRIRHNFFAA